MNYYYSSKNRHGVRKMEKNGTVLENRNWDMFALSETMLKGKGEAIFKRMKV